MTGGSRASANEKEREARDLEDVAEVEAELAGRPDLAAAARAVAREFRDERDYLAATKGEGRNAGAGR